MGKKQSPSVAGQNQSFDTRNYTAPPPSFGIGPQGSEPYNANFASGSGPKSTNNYMNPNTNHLGVMVPPHGPAGGNTNYRNNNNTNSNKRGGGGYGGGRNRRNSMKNNPSSSGMFYNGMNPNTGAVNPGAFHSGINRYFSGGHNPAYPSTEIMVPRMATVNYLHAPHPYNFAHPSPTFPSNAPTQSIGGSHDTPAQRHTNLHQGMYPPMNASIASYGPQVSGHQAPSSISPKINPTEPLDPNGISRSMSATAPTFHYAPPNGQGSKNQQISYDNQSPRQVPASYKPFGWEPEMNMSDPLSNEISTAESTVPDIPRTELQHVVAHYKNMLADARSKRREYLNELGPLFTRYRSKEMQHDGLMSAAFDRAIHQLTQAMSTTNPEEKRKFEVESTASMREAHHQQLESAEWRRKLENTRDIMAQHNDDEVMQLHNTFKIMVEHVEDAVKGKPMWPPTAARLETAVDDGSKDMSVKESNMLGATKEKGRTRETSSEPPTSIPSTPKSQVEDIIGVQERVQATNDSEPEADELVIKVSKRVERMQKGQAEGEDEGSSSDRTVITKDSPKARELAEKVKLATDLVQEALEDLTSKKKKKISESEMQIKAADHEASLELKVQSAFDDDPQAMVEHGNETAHDSGEKEIGSLACQDEDAVVDLQHPPESSGGAEEDKSKLQGENHDSKGKESLKITTTAKIPNNSPIVDDKKSQRGNKSKATADGVGTSQQAKIDRGEPIPNTEASNKNGRQRKKSKNFAKKQVVSNMDKDMANNGNVA